MIINNGKNFISIASKHPKKSKKIKNILINNIKVDKNNIKRIDYLCLNLDKEITNNFKTAKFLLIKKIN